MARHTLNPDNIHAKTVALTEGELLAIGAVLAAERDRLDLELEALRDAQAAHRANIAAIQKTIKTCTREMLTGQRTTRVRTRIEYDDVADTVHLIELDADLLDVGEIKTNAARQEDRNQYAAQVVEAAA